MQHNFERIADAIRAGYAEASRFRQKYRGFIIKAVDVSGGRWFGYDYSLSVRPDREEIWDAVIWREVPFDCHQCFGRSVSVSASQDLNRIKQPGCFLPMFDPATLEAGLRAARTEIDGFWHANSALAGEVAAIDAAKCERQSARDRRRAEKLAAKYGVDNLGEKWRSALR